MIDGKGDAMTIIQGIVLLGVALISAIFAINWKISLNKKSNKATVKGNGNTINMSNEDQNVG